MAGSFVPCGIFPPRHFPQVLRLAAVPSRSSTLQSAGGGEWKWCQRWKWMKFPDAPPVFGLLTLQLRVRWSPRFTVYCVGLTSGRSAVAFSHLDFLDSLVLFDCRFRADILYLSCTSQLLSLLINLLIFFQSVNHWEVSISWCIAPFLGFCNISCISI